jgi:hypothetical protein
VRAGCAFCERGKMCIVCGKGFVPVTEVERRDARIAELEAALGEALDALTVWVDIYGGHLTTRTRERIERLRKVARSPRAGG